MKFFLEAAPFLKALEMIFYNMALSCHSLFFKHEKKSFVNPSIGKSLIEK